MKDRIHVYVFKRKGRKNYEAEFTDPRSGRKRRRSLGTANRREAERMGGRLEKELRDGQWKATRKTPWKEFRRRYESEGLLGRADDTLAAFRTAANRLEGIVDPGVLQALTADMFVTFSSRLTAEGLSRYTVANYLRHLKAALRWAVRQELLIECPYIEMPKGTSRGRPKGRAISREEFERMLEKTAVIVGKEQAPSWVHLLEGLWLSGLRLGEALALSWDDPKSILVDLSGKFPMLRIPAEAEKGRKDRILPIAPDFAKFLRQIPEKAQYGRVFVLKWVRNTGKPVRVDVVSPKIATIGRKANVWVSETKCASAHDLRRSFGFRWSHKVKPHVLQQMMRHESIQTTMTYYVQAEADVTAEAIWSAYEQARANQPPELGTVNETVHGSQSSGID